MKIKNISSLIAALVIMVPAVAFARGSAEIPVQLMDQMFKGTPFEGAVKSIPQKDHDGSKRGGRDHSGGGSGGDDWNRKGGGKRGGGSHDGGGSGGGSDLGSILGGGKKGGGGSHDGGGSGGGNDLGSMMGGGKKGGGHGHGGGGGGGRRHQQD